jgi:hypothetical protein
LNCPAAQLCACQVVLCAQCVTQQSMQRQCGCLWQFREAFTSVAFIHNLASCHDGIAEEPATAGLTTMHIDACACWTIAPYMRNGCCKFAVVCWPGIRCEKLCITMSAASLDGSTLHNPQSLSGTLCVTCAAGAVNQRLTAAALLMCGCHSGGM